MTAARYTFSVVSPKIDEKAIRHDDPSVLVQLLSVAKAKAVAAQLSQPALVITCDQVIVCDGKTREKPADEAEARSYLQSYASYPAECICGVTVRACALVVVCVSFVWQVTNTATGAQATGVDRAVQHFLPVPDHEIDRLIADGTIFYCAGGFAVELMEGVLGAREGELETVIGLPRALTERLIKQVQP